MLRIMRVQNVLLPVVFFCLLLAAGAAAANSEQDKPVTHLSQQDFQQLIANTAAEDIAVIDVRSKREFSAGRVPGAVNIPHQQILDDPSIITRLGKKKVVFYCYTGYRVGKVTRALAAQQVKGLYHLQGDYRAWRGNLLPIEK